VEGMCQQSVGGDSPVEAVSHQMVAMTQELQSTQIEETTFLTYIYFT
jgi:hypothetical protein